MNTVSFIGSGNLATHLALTMSSKGYNIKCIYSRTIQSAQTLADKLSMLSRTGLPPYGGKATGRRATLGNGRGVRLTTTLNDIPPSDIIIISVTDSALEGIIKNIPQHLLGSLILHTAGSMPLSIFNSLPLREGPACWGRLGMGWGGSSCSGFGVLYPMQTFSKTAQVDFSHIPTFVEGSDEATTQRIKDIALTLTDNVTILSSADRKYLHIAAVFACNFANHVIDLGSTLLADHGIDPKCLLPLIDVTCSKLHTLTPHEAQTGPAARHDINVIDNHLNILKDDDHLRNIYKLLSNSIINVSGNHHS